MVDDILNGRTPYLDSTTDYNNGAKDVPAVLLQPVSIDKTNYDVLVRDGYFTDDELK